MYHCPLISTGVFDVNDVEARLIVLLYSDKKIIPISSRNKVFFPESQSMGGGGKDLFLNGSIKPCILQDFCICQLKLLELRILILCDSGKNTLFLEEIGIIFLSE
jgi:hypothetical protein